MEAPCRTMSQSQVTPGEHVCRIAENDPFFVVVGVVLELLLSISVASSSRYVQLDISMTSGIVCLHISSSHTLSIREQSAWS
jgi:hypothetical protein